jgi:hypothetical protein
MEANQTEKDVSSGISSPELSEIKKFSFDIKEDRTAFVRE